MGQGLILIDIQNDYFPGGRMELHGMEPAADNARQLLDAFRQRGAPVFHVQHLARQRDATFFLPDTDGARIHRQVAPHPGEVLVQKHFPNAFRETALRDELAGKGVEELVLCGAMTHMCVDATARAAFDLGFRLQIVEDACATRDLRYRGQVVAAASVQAAFLAALAAAYGSVLSTRDLLAADPAGA